MCAYDEEFEDEDDETPIPTWLSHSSYKMFPDDDYYWPEELEGLEDEDF